MWYTKGVVIETYLVERNEAMENFCLILIAVMLVAMIEDLTSWKRMMLKQNPPLEDSVN